MPNDLHLDKFSLKRRNIVKYAGEQPSWELVLRVIKKSGLNSRMNFQRVWGIPGQVLNQYKHGERDIPPQYWHIFYEFDELVKILKEKVKARKNETILGQIKKELPHPSKKTVLNKKLIDDQIKF
jgi:hypothetical protein